MNQQDEPVPVAVIGAGDMGANHIRVYDELPGSELVEVVEPDTERAKEIRGKYDVNVLDSVGSLSEAVAATVAVPNQRHRDVTLECIELGLDVLVEKPLALTVEDAESMVETAESNNSVLQVGHIERFNPAVQTLSEILDDHELIALEAHRLGPFTEHLVNESVIFDLMIHDVDIVKSLVRSEVSCLNAIGTTARSQDSDHAIAQFKFKNGVVGTTTASHVTHGKIRGLNVTTSDAYITLDYQKQEVVLQRRGTGDATTLSSRVGYRTETITETPYVKTREPLKNELEHFLECVRKRKTPLVDGSDGVEAVKLATQIVEEISC